MGDDDHRDLLGPASGVCAAVRAALAVSRIREALAY
jgi:hypothetical protein